jgi:hypothetical protein
VPSAFSLDVIPAKAGIHFDLRSSSLLFVKAKLPLPCGERVTFFACAKKVTKETHPGGRAFRTSLCSRFANALRRSADCTSLYSSGRARILRAPLRAFSSAHSPRPTGPRLGGILPQKQQRPRTTLIAQHRDVRVRNTLCPRRSALDLFGYFLGHCAAGAARTAEPARRAEGRACPDPIRGCPQSCQKVTRSAEPSGSF